MEQQSLTIEAFNEKLKSWYGKQIKITKKELQDLDETVLSLSDVTYTSNTERLDDYVPAHSLLLNGEGEIENEANEMEPLPSSNYEIPLTDAATYDYDGTRFTIITDRAEYVIEQA